MKELTQDQKAAAFDLFFELKGKGFADVISGGMFMNLCEYHNVKVDFSNLVVRWNESATDSYGKFSEAPYELLSVVKHLVSAKKLTRVANTTRHIPACDGPIVPTCDNCGCKDFNLIDGMVVCNDCLRVGV